MIAPDSSVAIAAAAPWHVAHQAAAAALTADQPALIAQVAFETTAALSRMPEGQRLAQRSSWNGSSADRAGDPVVADTIVRIGPGRGRLLLSIQT